MEASDQDGRVQRGALVGSATNETNPRLADAWQGLGIACELITPLQVRQRLHDFDKFWEMMRNDRGSQRPPLTEAQRRSKPPVLHPVFLQHPVTGRTVLYVNPGCTVRLDGVPAAQSEELLAFLFRHQLQDKYRYAHQWAEHDLLMWDNIGTVHRAIGDYGPDEHRLMNRCQILADRVFERDFLATPDLDA